MPSLVAIRSFHAVGEAGSIVEGAARLNVTPGAIRHQIRLLEEQVGQRLVHRGRRDLVLTPAGRALQARVAEAFRGLSEAFRDQPPGQARGELRVACAPALMALRLVKVLLNFSATYPLVTVRLETIEAAGKDTDVILSFGERPISGTRRAMLRNEAYFPVCSPSLFYGEDPIQEARDLERHVFLHSVDGEDWNRVLRALGRQDLAPRQEIFMPNAHLTLRAAREGLGIAIGSTILCAEDLRQGTLMKVLDLEIPAPFPYFVIMPQKEPHELAEAFISILVRELDR